MKVYATLPEVHVTAKGSEKNKEIYVVSLASDLHGKSNHRPPVVGASNETLSRLVPGLKSAMEFFAVAVSNVFPRISAKQPLSLTGDGIVLYPPTDPGGMIALHFVIVESDKGQRDIGSLLESLFSDDSVKVLLREASRATSSVGCLPPNLLSSLFSAMTSIVPAILKANKDDLLFAHSHSGVDFNGYGGSTEGTTYEIGNNRAGCTLAIWSRECG
jgi:hypothetical protein